ncbi:hypothetical protein LCY76_18165 [Fictibacillus sp. KIGAM418]|uniref:Uncharacterized protein n=1 Tax=Fictibacillus marinisediminis TaxID=2878389 RepID=A0A9X1XCT3_9BACL|nr:hypothetical protein [Fictibacillus marinisediminis]MCK6258502.1 hypothetical protein [Fictibacillus marinisediminis]
MNKKVKWSVISVSTLAFFTLGGLVAKNQNTGTTVQNNPSQESGRQDIQDDINDQGDSPAFTDNGQSDDFSQGEGQSSDWGQDQFQQGAQGGFDQGHGSSGSSR